MNRKLVLILNALLLPLLVSLPAGCSGDNCMICPNGEQEPEYYITWSYGLYPGNRFFTYRFSTLTHEIIDSMRWPQHGPSQMAFTPDGRYFIFANFENRSICATESDTWDTLSCGRSSSGGFALSAQGDLVIAIYSSELLLLTVPGFAEVLRDTVGINGAAFGPSGTILAVVTGQGIRVYRRDPDWRLQTQFPVVALDGEPVDVGDLVFSRDEKSLYLETGRLLGPYFFHVVEIESQRVVREYQLPFPSFLAPTPAGDALFVGYYGIFEDYGHGTVYRYDTQDSTFMKYVDREDFEEPGTSPPLFAPTGMIFLPDGRTTYFLNSRNPYGKETGPMIKYDLKTKTVLGFFKVPSPARCVVALDPRNKKKNE